MKEFHARFISNPLCHHNESEDFNIISPVISEEGNNFLISLVLGDEEIKIATFDLALENI